MQRERDRLWNDIQRIEQRREELKKQYEATGNTRLRQRAEAMKGALENLYCQLGEMAKSDSDRMRFVRH